MKVNPLLSNEISVSDQIDEIHNENYSKELKLLYDEIIEDLQKADTTGTGRVSEEELLDFLQKKLPPQRQLNIPLFKRFLQNVDQNIDTNIDLNEFCKKYIQAHEELKLNFETLKKGFDKEKNIKNELQEKIQEVKQEQMNKNGISQNAVVQTEIGKITFLAQINTDQIYCTVNLDENEAERSEIKNIENPIFVKKFAFHIDDKQSSLYYKVYSAQSNQYIGGVDVPLYMLNVENEEIFSEFELKDESDQTIGVFKPRIIVVTSYFDWYQKQYDNIDKNIESYQTKINELSETLEELSLPYKAEFEKSQLRLKQGGNILVNNDQLVSGVEGILKHAFKDRKVKFVGGILIMIAYDLIDYLFLRKFQIELMSRVEGWARFFGFLGFLGKIALFCAVFIVKIKYQKTGFILE